MGKAVLFIIILVVAIHGLATAQVMVRSMRNGKCQRRARMMDSIVARLHRHNQFVKLKSGIENFQVDPIERIDFLIQDFDNSDFRKACEVKCFAFAMKNGVHLGVVNIGVNEATKRACLKAIEHLGRHNFIVKVRTMFYVFERPSELVIVYSETPEAPLVKDLLESLSQY